MAGFLKIVLSVLRTMVPAIATVEAAIKELKAGSKKKEAVLSIVMSIPEIAEALSAKEFVDEKKFKEGVSELNDAIVKILNSVKKEVVPVIP